MRIMLIGSFSGENFGDSLVLAAIVRALDQALGEGTQYLVPTSRPQFVETFLPSERVQPVDIHLRRTWSYRFLGAAMLRALRSVDLIVTTAGILFDHRLLDPRFNFIGSLLPVLAIARRRRIPVVGLNVGITPPSSWLGRKALAWTLALHDHLTTRDEPSAVLARELSPGVPVIAAADIAHLWFDAAPAPSPQAPARLGVSLPYCLDRYDPASGAKPLTEAEFVQQAASNLLTLAGTLGCEVDLLATTVVDHALHQKVASAMALASRGSGASPRLIALHEMPVHEAVQAVGSLRMMIASRMHACLMATAMGVPTLALQYHPKVASYMRELGQEAYVLPVAAACSPSLVKLATQMQQAHDSIRSHLLARQAERRLAASRGIEALQNVLASRQRATQAVQR